MSKLITYLNLTKGEVKYRTLHNMRKFLRNRSPLAQLERSRGRKRRISPNGMVYTLYYIFRVQDSVQLLGSVVYCHEYNISFVARSAAEVISELDYIKRAIEKTSEEVTVVNVNCDTTNKTCNSIN